MRGNEFLDKMELIDPVYVEAADTRPKQKRAVWRKWGALAACLCIIAGTVAMSPYFLKDPVDPQLGEIVLSEKTTAEVSYGYEGEIERPVHDLLELTEEEMFSRPNMYVFRGTVSGLTNITIDFNGEKEVRCIATVAITEVYQGDIAAGEQITMLLPCGIAVNGEWIEDTDIVQRLECGMEGIFMPRIYDENSCMKQNGAVLMMRDLAVCGLLDGMRWIFLSGDQGLIYMGAAYPGAKDATNLDDIESYVIEMLK